MKFFIKNEKPKSYLDLFHSCSGGVGAMTALHNFSKIVKPTQGTCVTAYAHSVAEEFIEGKSFLDREGRRRAFMEITARLLVENRILREKLSAHMTEEEIDKILAIGASWELR